MRNTVKRLHHADYATYAQARHAHHGCACNRRAQHDARTQRRPLLEHVGFMRGCRIQPRAARAYVRHSRTIFRGLRSLR